jgi:hypothetical protein
MATRSARVGVHGRNDYWQCKFEKSDYQLIQKARIEHVKMMISDQAANPEVLKNAVGVYTRLREINPDMDFVVRLSDAEVKDGRHPTPQAFANRFIPIMNKLYDECPYVVKFEVLNEPNHIGGLGGWGPEADKARGFSRWFLETCDLLKAACPWAGLGFPGLAIPHGPEPGLDLDWIEICRDAVERSDWLGVHCYWQNPTDEYRNHMADFWGLRFNAYHEKFPDKVIEITEFGNSNGQGGYPVVPDKIAQEYVEYYRELFNYPYINSAASFIMSSLDATWGDQGFTWRKENGEFWPVVRLVGAMERPPLVPAVTWRYFPETQRTVKGVFLDALNRYGLEVCGYPITEQFEEAGLPSQYFERVAMEESERGKIRFKAVSDEALRARQAMAQLQWEAQSLRQQATASQATIAQLQQEVQGLRQQAAASQETLIQLWRQVDTLRQQLVVATTTTPVARPSGPPSPATTPVTTSVVITPPVTPAVTTPAIALPPMEDVTIRLRRHTVKRFERRTLDQIKYLVIQHSVLPGDFPPEKIANFLVEKKQWPGIGYHFYITSDGKIYQTNDLETVCYFAGSNVQYNPLGVCICFAGNFTAEVPTPAQLSSGGKLLAFLMQELHLPMENIRGQKEFVITQSPGNQWDSGQKWKDMLLAKVREAQS